LFLKVRPDDLDEHHQGPRLLVQIQGALMYQMCELPMTKLLSYISS
jgi:hypothetical protein